MGCGTYITQPRHKHSHQLFTCPPQSISPQKNSPHSLRPLTVPRRASSKKKRIDANAAALTNFDVLDFLRRRGAGTPTRVLVPVAPSEFKVYDYLIQTAASDQTREILLKFLEKCKECKYNLEKAELFNIINTRPSTAVEIDPIIEECETRLPLETLLPLLLEMIEAVLPPSPSKPQLEEQNEEDKEGTAENAELEEDGTQIEADGVHIPDAVKCSLEHLSFVVSR